MNEYPINSTPQISSVPPLIECQMLSKSYRNGFPVLFNINLKIEPGKIIGLLGPNGCGKTTFIKLICGLLVPTTGSITVCGKKPGPETAGLVSYLPDCNYLSDWMKVKDIVTFFSDFYSDFDSKKAYELISRLGINENDKLKTMSKGTKEKVQLILVMSRKAKLYVLDEPIGGVDPAARDYILSTILTNYNPEASVIISTHLINDVEKVLDEVIFIQNHSIKLHATVDEIRREHGKSVDELFREVYKC